MDRNDGAVARPAKAAHIIAMAIAAIIVGLFGTNAMASDPGAHQRAFVRALELFDSAKTPDDYRESAAVLESILADGFRNGAVYYNLGNAYFRAGDFGRAVLSYRKAKVYRPRDPYLNANLQQALATAPGRLNEPPRPWWTHVLFWTDLISFPMKVQVCFVGMILSALTMVAGNFLRRPRVYWLTGGLLLLCVLVGVDAALCYDDALGQRRAVITGETIARKGTGESYEPAFDQPLRDGAEFEVLNQTADWTFGHFESIGDGWVRNEFVAR